MLECSGERHELHWKKSRVWHWYCELGYQNWEVCGTVNWVILSGMVWYCQLGCQTWDVSSDLEETREKTQDVKAVDFCFIHQAMGDHGFLNLEI